MRRVMSAAVALAIVAVVGLSGRANDPKNSIKDVMKQAHAGGNKSLLFRVAGGKGTKEDAEKLLALYKDLAANKPEKGEAASWKEKTDPIVKAAEAVVAGEKGAPAKLKMAVNCMNCHKEHKPS
ncbi:MAG: hypothetical protein ACJ8F7_23560 [Gemmataceae bacterium]